MPTPNINHLSLVKQGTLLDWYLPDPLAAELPLPMAEAGVSAGFPSPAGDYIELKIDLNTELVPRPSSTFYARVKGQSMKDIGITDGDILVIDKSLEPRDGDTVVCYIDGGFTVKNISIKDKKVCLLPANPRYPVIEISPDDEFIVWGVVTYNIQNLGRR